MSQLIFTSEKDEIDFRVHLADIEGIAIDDLNFRAKRRIVGRNLLLWQGDITTLKVDAIVNAANPQLQGPSQGQIKEGVDGAIRRKAGYLLVRECKSLRNCLQVEAKITKGYKLPEITVIHTVGPNCSGQEIQKSDKDMLRKCYQNCLKLCDVINLSSIAFCLISCGEFGYDVYVGTQISLEESTNYLRDKPDSSIKDIIFTAFDPNDANIFDRVFEGKKRNN